METVVAQKGTVKFRGFDYDLPEEFTRREVVEIEQLTGVPVAEWRGRYSVVVAMAAIAMKRAGAKITYDELLDSDDELEVDFEDESDIPKAPGEAAASEEPEPEAPGTPSSLSSSE